MEYSSSSSSCTPKLHVQTPNNNDNDEDDDNDNDNDNDVDIFSSDEFRMFEFKIRPCTRARSHDWTDCPWAHPGEKARRRDPVKTLYSSSLCPDFKNSAAGSCSRCPRGERCGFAHGVFERWLHPAKYRTAACRDGVECRRRVCFFAHSEKELRAVESTSSMAMFMSPTSILGWRGLMASPEAVEIGGEGFEWVDELIN